MRYRYLTLLIVAAAVGFYAGAYQGATATPRALVPCTTDTNCMQKNGGDGGPQICHINTDC